MNIDYFLHKMETEQICLIRQLPGKYIPFRIAIGLQQNSPFKKIFDYS